MPVWGWVLIGLGILAAVVAVVVFAVRRTTAARRTQRLRGRFGPEYDRTVRRADDRRDAEARLTEREEPAASVGAADALIQTVMVERGYPVEDFDRRADDLSVDHPRVVEHYRAGHRLAQGAGDDGDGTEELRRAMRHYRALFDELVESPADEPVMRDRTSDGQDTRPDEQAAARPRR